jgi:hypothetical protein
LFNDMADDPATLPADKGAAARLALWVLSAIILVQAGVIAWLLRSHGLPTPAVTELKSPAASASPPPPAVSLPVSLSSLPALPPPPGALARSSPLGMGRDLPPSPGQLGSAPPPAAAPPPSFAPPPSAPPSVTPAPQAVAAQQPISLTNNAEVDELLSSAKDMVAINDAVAMRAALEVLQRADLILPEHPAVLREMALVHQKLNEGDKAKVLFDRANAARSSLPRAPSTPTTGGVPALLPAPTSTGPVTIGRTRVTQDLTATTGEKQVLRLELRSMPGLLVDASKITLDVFFYDLVDGKRVEQSKGDAPVWKFDEPVDFTNDNAEVVDITYHMPRLTESELREHGSRAYHGFVARLHYDGQFMSETAEPRSLLLPGRHGLQGSLPAAQP